jgi:hypothetical protein
MYVLVQYLSETKPSAIEYTFDQDIQISSSSNENLTPVEISTLVFDDILLPLIDSSP